MYPIRLHRRNKTAPPRHLFLISGKGGDILLVVPYLLSHNLPTTKIDDSFIRPITHGSTSHYSLRTDGHYDLFDAAASFQKSTLVGAGVGFPPSANGVLMFTFSAD